MSEQDGPNESAGAQKQPNSSHCFVCGLDNPKGLGMSFYNTGTGRVEARYTAPTAYEGYPGVVHGGIIASMMDEVVGRVAMIDDPNHFLVTAKLELRYRKPVPSGVELRLAGELQRQRGRVVYATAQLFLPDGSVGAEAEATLVDKPGEKVDEELLRALGWKVYMEADG